MNLVYATCTSSLIQTLMADTMFIFRDREGTLRQSMLVKTTHADTLTSLDLSSNWITFVGTRQISSSKKTKNKTYHATEEDLSSSACCQTPGRNTAPLTHPIQ